MSFKERVFAVVRGIPRGRTLSYKEVARRAGNKKAYRVVGNILNRNCDPEIPCHRVIRADRSIGGYNRDVKEKIKLLKKEGTILV